MKNLFCPFQKSIFLQIFCLGIALIGENSQAAATTATDVLKAMMSNDKVAGNIVSSKLNSFQSIVFTDKNILEAKFYYARSNDNNSPNTVLSLSDGKIKSYDKGAVSVRCANGKFEAHSGSYINLGMACEIGKAYRIEVIANTNTKKYSVKIVSSSKESIQKDNLSFRAQVSKLNSLNFITDSLTSKSKIDLVAAGVFNELKVVADKPCKLENGDALAHLGNTKRLRFKNTSEVTLAICVQNSQEQVATCNNGVLSGFTPSNFLQSSCSLAVVNSDPFLNPSSELSPMASAILDNPMPEIARKKLLEFLSRTQVGPFKKCSDLPSVPSIDFTNQHGRIIQNVNVQGGIKIGNSKNVIIRNVCAHSINTVSGTNVGGGGTLVEHVYLDGKFTNDIGVNAKGTIVVRNSIVENFFDHLRALNLDDVEHLKTAGLDTNLPYGAIFKDSLYGYWGAKVVNGKKVQLGNHADFYQWPVWSTNHQPILFQNNFIFGKDQSGNNFNGMTVNSIKQGMDFIGNTVIGAQDGLRISAVESGGRILNNVFEKSVRCYDKEDAKKKVEWSGNKDLNGNTMAICSK